MDNKEMQMIGLFFVVFFLLADVLPKQFKVLSSHLKFWWKKKTNFIVFSQE